MTNISNVTRNERPRIIVCGVALVRMIHSINYNTITFIYDFITYTYVIFCGYLKQEIPSVERGKA